MGRAAVVAGDAIGLLFRPRMHECQYAIDGSIMLDLKGKGSWVGFTAFVLEKRIRAMSSDTLYSRWHELMALFPLYMVSLIRFLILVLSTVYSELPTTPRVRDRSIIHWTLPNDINLLLVSSTWRYPAVLPAPHRSLSCVFRDQQGYVADLIFLLSSHIEPLAPGFPCSSCLTPAS